MAEQLRGLGELDLDRLRRFCAVETALYGRLLAVMSGVEIRRLAG